MSAALGETIFQSTGWTDANVVLTGGGANHFYCAGCNGSFRLTFTSTSQGGSNGVYGAGFDVSNQQTVAWIAYVTLGDLSTMEVPLDGTSFFGITSDKLIRSVHVGLTGGGTTQNGNIEMDNLTVGNICGDGSPGGAEGCDDGNGVDSDCCHNDCTAAPALQACGSPAVTTCSGADSCDGNGACLANDVPAGTSMAGCDDGIACTFEQCNGAGGCQNPPKSYGTSCDDATVCNGHEYCSGAGACLSGSAPDCDDGDVCSQDSCDPLSGCTNDFEPAATCSTGLKGSLQIKHNADDGSKNQLKWKLSGGNALEQAASGIRPPRAATRSASTTRAPAARHSPRGSTSVRARSGPARTRRALTTRTPTASRTAFRPSS